jgi:tetratricopeptide (TPR) repeat protein
MLNKSPKIMLNSKIAIYKLISLTFVLLIQILWVNQVIANPESIKHLKYANDFSRSEKWNEAIVEYKKTLEFDSENTEALANLGVAYSRLNDHKEALLNYEKALIKGYDNAMFRYFRGLSFANLSLLDEAVKEIKLALKMNPRLMEAKFDLGIIYQMRGQSDLAREQVKKLYTVSPKMAKKLFDKVTPVYKYQKITNGGSFTGVASIKGPIPNPRVFHLVHSPNIEFCSRISDGKGHRIVYDFEVGKGGELKNTLIAIKGITKGKPFPDKVQKFNIDRCRSDKYIIGINNGEDILVENTDPIVHEIATYEIRSPHIQQKSNRQVLPKTSQIRSAFIDHRASEFTIKCNLHPFLQTRGFMVDNPYYAITDDNGAFNIPDIPPGTYEVIAWHPLIPTLSGTITIKENEDTKLNFEFNGENARTKLYTQDTVGYRFDTWFDNDNTFYGDKRIDDPVEILQKFDNSERYQN